MNTEGVTLCFEVNLTETSQEDCDTVLCSAGNLSLDSSEHSCESILN